MSELALNQGLVTARDRNRAILKRLTDQFTQGQTAAKKRLVDPSYTEVPIGNPSPEEREPLQSSAAAMAALIRAGARTDDLSSIYCVECKLSDLKTPSHLAHVNFDTSYLRRADFTGADLTSASFHNADLILTNFTGSNLRLANFTADAPLEPWTVAAAVYSGDLASAWGANFACSDLSYADFSGDVMFSLIYQNPTYGGNMRDELYKADLRGTKLRTARVLVAVPDSLTGSAHQRGGPTLMPAELSPTTSGVFSPVGEPVRYFGGLKYSLWIGDLDGADQRIRAMPNEYRRDLVITMSSFVASSHFVEADLPDSIRSFVTENSEKLKKPFLSYDCKGGKSADVSDMFSPDDKGPKNTRF